MNDNSINEKDIFAQIKYEGKLVEDGFLDARKAGEALIGIDETLRHFIYSEDNKFKNLDFEIPVKVKKGSWVTEFLANFDAILIKTALTWGASKYFGSALSEMAKSDFKEVGFKDIFKQSFKSMTWVLKIALHLGTITKKKFENIKFIENSEYVELVNDEGILLKVPIKYLEIFTNCPNNRFEKLAKIIEVERELIISYNDTEQQNQERVEVGFFNKQIFIPNEDEEEILFPELEHDMFVELTGHITRGNENSNTIGFMYEGHILTCYPSEGNIKDYKNRLFSNCILKGYVDRINKKTGDFIEKRPRIKFITIESNESDNKQQSLF
ncbi:hypothetical protein Q4553_13195 [Tenacibaculum soleae]|uniref:hypothetical protein n=1 Tax=Tenacibaculum soleae TaxID=447689 RepID=UPI0026E3CA37|nr:hypothetical protein [Tenacibaculum soleae]MDO6745524.1 hypothetical protein [Tenacibaculum soleae]